MKILKTILLVIGGLIGLLLIVAIFVKKDYAVVREVTINKGEAEVFAYIKNLKNQQDYSKWASMDPNQKTTYTGEDGTVGFISAWESEKEDVGAGEQEIISITENERIDYELRFLKPFESKAGAYMHTDSVGPEQTTVQWGFTGATPYPLNLMTAAMDMEGMIGKDLQTGLDNLKAKLENE